MFTVRVLTTLQSMQSYIIYDFIYIIKGDMFVYLFVCLLPMASRTAGPIKTKLGIGTHVDPGSVLVKVKVKVMWCHLVNANKTRDRGPQGTIKRTA